MSWKGLLLNFIITIKHWGLAVHGQRDGAASAEDAVCQGDSFAYNTR